MKALLPAALLLATLPALADDIRVLTAETKEAVLPVLPKIVGAMQQAVADKGASEAIGVCKAQAPALIQAKSKETGWEIRRVSLKPRNPGRATPDDWEVRQLADFNIRVANGEKPETLEGRDIAIIDGKPVFRYIKALPVGEVCLSCHGPAESLDAGVKAALAKNYPQDQATGYSLGQIRGGLTVKRPL